MKSAPSALLTDIAKNVTSFATLITLTRDDGVTINFTQHDTPITIDGVTFRNDIPYNLSAIDTNSDLSVDSTSLEVGIDRTVFTHRDIANDLYRGGQIQIALVDWRNLTSGRMILRQGWFTQLQDNRPNTLVLEIGGLMKVLDMGVGRIYQPGCDADFGDNRCHIALDPSKGYSYYNPTISGDWFYVYDSSELTALTGTNLGFETGDLTGWTESTNAEWGQPVSPSFPYPEGTHCISGVEGSITTPSEQFFYQDFALTPTFSTTDIDAGKIAFLLAYLVMQRDDVHISFPRTVCEVLDANGNILDTKDSRYLTLDAADSWRERFQHINCKPGARTVRVYFYAKNKSGAWCRVAYDRVQVSGYDITTAAPDHHLIFKATRTPNFDDPQNDYTFANPSFEQANSATSTTEDILGWTKAGSYWGVSSSGPYGAATAGSRVLVAGDNASGVQTTYTIKQDITFNASWVDLTRLAQGKIVGRFSLDAFWGDTTSAAGCVLEFFDGTGASLGTKTALADTMAASFPSHATTDFDFALPAHTTKMRITLRAVSPSGVSLAKIAFDRLRLRVCDAERPNTKKDFRSGVGEVGTTFNYTSGLYTVDNQVVLRAFPTLRLTDVVSAVTNKKTFNGTDIVGDFGAYETGTVEWLSGNNAGRMSIIRTWEPGGKEIKAYFPLLNDIQVGDRYAYTPGCQKRFKEDCVFRFNNALNFQGFPYLPGAVSPDGSAPVNDDTATPADPVLTLTQTPGASTGTGTTVDYRANLVEGDLIFAVCWNATTVTVPTAPDGSWKLIASAAAANGGSHRCSVAVYAKVAVAQDVADGSGVFPNTTHWCTDNATPSLDIANIYGNQSAYTDNGAAPPFTFTLGAQGSGVVSTLSGVYLPKGTVKKNGVDTPLAGVIGFITGLDNSAAVTVNTQKQLTPSGQHGVQQASVPNFLSPALVDRSVNGLDLTSVKLAFVWRTLPTGMILGGLPGTGGGTVANIALAFGILVEASNS